MDLPTPVRTFLSWRNVAKRARPDSGMERAYPFMTIRSDNGDRRNGKAGAANVSRIVSVELAGEDLAALEAWREVHRLPTLEAAVEELVRRALLDEISGIEELVVKARTRLGLGAGFDDSDS